MTWSMKAIFSCFALLILLGGRSSAATRSAASCSQPDVQAAIDASVDGDTVLIPAGTCTWTKTVVIAAPPSAGTGYWPSDPRFMKYLTLQGAGIGQTVIIDAVPASNYSAAFSFLANAIAVYAKPGGLTRVTGMTLKRDKNVPTAAKGMLSQGGTSNTWRIDHIHFICDGENGITVNSGASGGVIDHNDFELPGWYYGIYGFNGGDFYGDYAWAQPNPAGTAIPFFIEDNTFRGTTINTVAHDGWNGERVVFRRNTLHNAIFTSHGLESSGRGRSIRFREAYDNKFTFTIDDFYAYHHMGLRGGNGVFFNNTATGPSSMPPPYRTIDATYMRDYNEFPPYGSSDGHSVWDLNDPAVYATGSHNGPAGSKTAMTDTSKNWTANQWVGYSVRNLTKKWGANITANSANTLTFALSSHFTQVFDPGDQYSIKKVIAAPDQTGRGQGDLLSGDSPINTALGAPGWPRQASELSYAWNNTYNGHPVTISSQSPHIIENRDFVNGPMPGYTPYVYPHPLVAAAAPSPMPPSKPKNLAAR